MSDRFPIAATPDRPELEVSVDGTVLAPLVQRDIVEVDASELKTRLLFVPESLYHVRVELEDGTDWYVSFNRRFWKESDDFRTYEGVELYDLHLDGIPVDAGDLDFLFEEDLERLEQFVWEQEVGE
jgi:hypothetical protein